MTWSTSLLMLLFCWVTIAVILSFDICEDHYIQQQGQEQEGSWYKNSITVSSYVLQYRQQPAVKTRTNVRQTPSQLFSGSSNNNNNNNNNSIDELLPTKATTTTTTTTKSTFTSSNHRRNTVTVQQQLLDWANRVNIQISSNIQLQNDPGGRTGNESSGYGWYIQNNKGNNDAEILLSVPSSVALVVEASITSSSTTEVLPWYVNMALKLCQLDQMTNGRIAATTDSGSNDYHPWLQSLPRQFDTPWHWQENTLQNLLQYPYLQNSVTRQRQEWQSYYNTYVQQHPSVQTTTTTTTTKPLISFEHFIWGCECARSRAFAGSYSGSAYNPNLYIFTLLLITIYVGGNFGTLEQAANGAGVVFAATILKDFVIPKFLKVKRYVICPMIDMTNHNSRKAQGEVAFEYFSNSYSLSIKSNTVLQPNEQVYISYGTRSNDQLLQYYGFVESNNPHDVYVMPPIREWDISALEIACGRAFQPGRLQQLDAAGLLGNTRISGNVSDDDGDNDDNYEMNSKRDGVVISRGIGLDPAILQALRVLVSSDDEWNAAGQSIGNFSVERNSDNEQCARLVARTAIEMELSTKPTTLDADLALLKQMDTMSRIMADSSTEERLAIQFRIEKKRLLQETIALIQQQ
jgi:Rubisco LSMT substrate-binding